MARKNPAKSTGKQASKTGTPKVRTAVDTTSVDNGPTRLAVIDIGTNSTRLVVAEATEGGGFRILDDEKIMTRLGAGFAASGKLTDEAMEDTAKAVLTLRTIADGYGVRTINAVATCAVREATNGSRFAAMVNDVAQLSLHIISSEEEGRLAFRSVSQAFDLSGQRVAVADIGGGSTEVVLASGNVIEKIYALPLGAVRLTEMFGLAEDIDSRAYRRMRKFIEHTIQDRLGTPTMTPSVLIGTGGTFTTMAQIERLARQPEHAEDTRGRTSVRGFEMQHARVRHLVEGLRKRSLAERVAVPGLTPDRADIIVAGLCIIDRLLNHLGVNVVRVHDQGIRTGYLLDTLRKIDPDYPDDSSDGPPSRLEVVRRFARSCHVEPVHAEHVRWLALRLFDELGPILPDAGERWYTEEARGLLEAAALLHEVGYFINYNKHHLHAYHLIMHADLPGFDHVETELIANIARYHRRSRPRKKHRTYKRLSPSDRQLVQELAAILRLAVGLDRARDQKVKDVRAESEGRRVRITVDADEQPLVNLWGTERKSALFERVFKRKIEVLWADDAH